MWVVVDINIRFLKPQFEKYYKMWLKTYVVKSKKPFE